jgi:hypothetical protein
MERIIKTKPTEVYASQESLDQYDRMCAEIDRKKAMARMIKTNQEFIEMLMANHTELTVGQYAIANLNGRWIVFDGVSAICESTHPSLQEAVNAAVNLHAADILKTNQRRKR